VRNILGEASEARSGASKEIGASITRHLADEGAAVVVNYAASKEGAGRVVAEIERHGGKAIAVQASVAKHADVERLFSETKKAFGRLDILVHNAGRIGNTKQDLVSPANPRVSRRWAAR
jgi:NAD(P)-dependent dehydrogenase (short-subunit alcohol dehydrogenase family)